MFIYGILYSLPFCINFHFHPVNIGILPVLLINFSLIFLHQVPRNVVSAGSAVARVHIMAEIENYIPAKELVTAQLCPAGTKGGTNILSTRKRRRSRETTLIIVATLFGNKYFWKMTPFHVLLSRILSTMLPQLIVVFGIRSFRPTELDETIYQHRSTTLYDNNVIYVYTSQMHKSINYIYIIL